ncbi:metallophosphoesterase [bacterium SCSIO 12741]|nr:metallophosphoesterase [bacterium SCSIO 12741]
MKSPLLYSALCLLIMLSACQSETNKPKDKPIVEAEPEVVYKFAFVGCNRVNYSDRDNPAATNASTANVQVLKRTLNEIAAEKERPDVLFFLGDLVEGLSDTSKLDTQLQAWVAQYQDPAFSNISKMGIELIAVPGNHEMLYYKEYPGDSVHDEWPLQGATDTWLKHMSRYMPNDRDRIGGPDSLANRLTYSIVRNRIGFILMNTDTYNAIRPTDPKGDEGLIPTDWIIAKIKQFQNDPDIDHVFVLGHKPYYVSGVPETGHRGLPEGPVLWPAMQKHHVLAMLSAHVHDYQRMQPQDTGTYQIIAGNGGTEGTATFFGYSMIHILSNGEVKLISKGVDVNPQHYYLGMPDSPNSVRDSTILTWTKNTNPYRSGN